MSLVNPFAQPGMGTPAESSEREFMFGNRESYHIESGVIVSTAADSGNTPTTTLRRGLVVGKVTATGKWKQYSSTATDGSQIALGILYEGRNMLNPVSGSAEDQQGQFVISGFVRAGQLIGLDAQARQQLRSRFLFDDEIPGYYSPEFVQEVAKTADYTIVAADRGTLFTNTGAVGAVIFTLPTPAPGLKFGFFVVADQNVTIASAGSNDDIITFNDAAADSVAFTTAGNKIGAMVVFYANAAGTKWYMEKRCQHTMTVA